MKRTANKMHFALKINVDNVETIKTEKEILQKETWKSKRRYCILGMRVDAVFLKGR